VAKDSGAIENQRAGNRGDRLAQPPRLRRVADRDEAVLVDGEPVETGTNVVELSRSGTVLRTLDLAPQGVNDNEITGLAFDAAGNLFVASDQGVVYKVDVT